MKVVDILKIKLGIGEPKRRSIRDQESPFYTFKDDDLELMFVTLADDGIDYIPVRKSKTDRHIMDVLINAFARLSGGDA